MPSSRPEEIIYLSYIIYDKREHVCVPFWKMTVDASLTEEIQWIFLHWCIGIIQMPLLYTTLQLTQNDWPKYDLDANLLIDANLPFLICSFMTSNSFIFVG